MTKLHKLCMTIAVAAAVSAPLAMAYPGGANMTEEQRMEYRAEKFERLSERLALTDAQRLDVEAILIEQGDKRRSLRKESRQEFKEQRQALAGETRSMLAGVLTEDQLAEFDQMRQEHKAMRKERREAFREAREQGEVL